MMRLKLNNWFQLISVHFKVKCMYFTLKCTKQLISTPACWYLGNWWLKAIKVYLWNACISCWKAYILKDPYQTWSFSGFIGGFYSTRFCIFNCFSWNEVLKSEFQDQMWNYKYCIKMLSLLWTYLHYHLQIN